MLSKLEIIELRYAYAVGFNYIVKNKNGKIRLFKEMPIKSKSDVWTSNFETLDFNVLLGDYNFINWDNGVWSIEDLLVGNYKSQRKFKPKYEEARISILLSNVVKEHIMCKLNKQYGSLFYYSLGENDYEMTILVSDRMLNNDLICSYYDQIVNYFNGVGENLSEEDQQLRYQEVASKWLNGNFNYWILDN